MVLRFYNLKQNELDQLYRLEDQFPDDVTVGETHNALAGEQYIELIVGLSGVVLPLVVELLKIWAEKKKTKTNTSRRAKGEIENLEMMMHRPDGTTFIIRADRISEDTAETLLDAVGIADDD